MNEIELLAGLRAEVPAPDSAPVEHAVMTALRERDRTGCWTAPRPGCGPPAPLLANRPARRAAAGSGEP